MKGLPGELIVGQNLMVLSDGVRILAAGWKLDEDEIPTEGVKKGMPWAVIGADGRQFHCPGPAAAEEFLREEARKIEEGERRLEALQAEVALAIERLGAVREVETEMGEAASIPRLLGEMEDAENRLRRALFESGAKLTAEALAKLGKESV
jgi:hypothetical protein